MFNARRREAEVIAAKGADDVGNTANNGVR